MLNYQAVIKSDTATSLLNVSIFEYNQMEEVKKILRKILAAIYDEKECSIRTLEKKIEKLIESVSVNGNG